MPIKPDARNLESIPPGEKHGWGKGRCGLSLCHRNKQILFFLLLKTIEGEWTNRNSEIWTCEVINSSLITVNHAMRKRMDFCLIIALLKVMLL